MSKIATIGVLGIRRLLRDRIALFFILLLPTVIILIIGVAIFGAAGGGIDRGQVGVLDQDAGPLATDLIERLEEKDLFDFVDYRDVKTLRTDIRRETIDAAIVIPAGYTEDLRAGREVEMQFLSPTVDPQPAIRTIAGEALAAQGAEVKAANLAASVAGGSFDSHLGRAREIEAGAGAQGAVTVASETLGVEHADEFPGGFRYPAASNLVLFVFITSLAGSTALVESRRLGISRRMLATPTSARTILLGETFARFMIAGFQGLFIFAIGALVFRVDWGDHLAAGALIVLFSLVGTGIGMLGGTIYRTPEQAQSVSPPVGIALGMLGGCMWPLEIVPQAMRTFGHITPHAWAMDAFIDIIGKGEDITGITTQLAVLAGFAIVLIPLAAWRLRRTLVA